jgi:S-adenosylmethionine synthetase
MSRKVSGRVYSDSDAHAMYFVHWTLGQVPKHGAHIDIIIGEWDDRSAVSLEYRIGETGPSVMVIDAHGRDHADPSLIKRVLRREDVIGTPLAKQVFAICDAILLLDERLVEITWGPE